MLGARPACRGLCVAEAAPEACLPALHVWKRGLLGDTCPQPGVLV